MNVGKYTRKNPYGLAPRPKWSGEKAPPLRTFPGLPPWKHDGAALASRRPQSGHGTVASDLAELSVGTAASWRGDYAQGQRRRRRASSGRPASATTTAINFLLPYTSGGKRLTRDERRFRSLLELDRITAKRGKGLSVDSSAAVAKRWLRGDPPPTDRSREKVKGWVKLSEKGSGWSLVTPVHRVPSADGPDADAAAAAAAPRRENPALPLVRTLDDIREKCHDGQRVALLGTVVRSKLCWPHSPTSHWQGCGLMLGDGTIVNVEAGYDEIPGGWAPFLRKPVRIEAQIWRGADPTMELCVRGPHMTDWQAPFPVIAGGGAPRKLPQTHSREFLRRNVCLPQCRHGR